MKSERMGRFHKLAGNEFQTVGAIRLKERLSTDLRLRLGIFKSFSFDNWRVCEVLICAVRSSKVRGKCTVEVTVGKRAWRCMT